VQFDWQSGITFPFRTFANRMKPMIKRKLAVCKGWNGLSILQTNKYADIQQHCHYNVQYTCPVLRT